MRSGSWMLLPLGLMAMAASVSAAVPDECAGEGSDRIRATAPSERFHLPSGYDVVVDKATGLLWARCPLGYTLGQLGVCEPQDGAQRLFTWGEAMAAVQAVNDAANPFLNTGLADGWHLPNVKELASIVERRCLNPALNDEVFPGHPSGYYWSATPAPQTAAPSTTNPTVSTEQRVFAVSMSNGAVTTIVKGDYGSGNERGYALPVRELSDTEFADWLSR